MSNDMFSNMNLTDLSYLLDPDASVEENKKEGSKESNSVNLPISFLMEFNGHPFTVDTNEEDFQELVDSIKQNGVIYPVLVRPSENDNSYEIISGHRRVAAAKTAGLVEIPAIVRELSDYEATVLMVHTNLYRSKISIKEKAKAYRLCLDQEKHSGIKGVDTAAAIGAEASDSRRKVYRFIRLSYLSETLLDYVDIGKLSEYAGVELSYLDITSMGSLEHLITECKLFPTMDQAKAVRDLYKIKKESLSYKDLYELLVGKPKKKTSSNVSFKKKELETYFKPDTDAEYMSSVILRLLQKYKDGELDQFLN